VDTLVIFMGAKNLPRIVTTLLEAGRAPSTPMAIIEWGTYADQRVRVATLGTVFNTLTEAPVEPPALIIIGDVVSLSGQLSAISPQPKVTPLETNDIASIIEHGPILESERQSERAERLRADR
jgi:hypothetical protein